ncbi:uncharacterized protein LOC116139224 [Pistacia vera]|uniref:uncharacterized protein LOC116139224 n=1 Tax=Pistacia vera TaxID=55513 RepID=UPI001263C781|nr:uncharacterized protein LOC116139224 [Pistacia vera]
MELHQVFDLAKCRYLAVTLTAHAKRWFRSLPAGSVGSWPQISSTFLRHFQANRKFSMPLSYLSNILQDRAEPLQSYIDKFHRELHKVAHTPEEFVQTLIIVGVHPQTDLWKELQSEDDVSLTRFYNLTKKYLRIESSMAALSRHNPSLSGSAPNSRENKRANRRWANNDQ